MGKSRRYIKRSSQTKRGKRGGQKNENNNPILSTQMQGGQAAPRPRPAPAPAGLNIYSIDAVSLRSSLQSFGDAVLAFKDTAETGLDTFKIPTGIPDPLPTSGASYSLLFSQKNSSTNLLAAANNVVKAFYNTNSTTVDGIPGGGIFRAIYGPSAVFVATPMPPAPPPTAVGGFMHIGGVAPAPRPAPAGNGIVIASEAALLASLQAFGNKLIAFRTAAEAQVTQLASPDISDFQPTASTGAAYGAFVAQQTAASNLVDAAKAVLAAFAGSPSVAVPDVTGATVYDGVNGIRGLYRAIMGNSANFIAT